MILYGMYDSPFVRRVAVTMRLYGMPYEHRPWSVGRDQLALREVNPLGRVPALVLDSGETLVDSSAILDFLDEQAGAARALLPTGGPERRHALQLIALSLGAVEKGLHVVLEHVFRPVDKRHEPWLARCRAQIDGALAALERHCAEVPAGHWLLGTAPMQPDITLACVYTYLREATGVDFAPYPALRRCAEQTLALPALREIYLPFDAPVGA
ncbi:glutathione S-transferase family protein [Solimonas variicoloris]|uniref:glutathione S-transferase family protein n=1 Tax=Solimonas variicoloris TaxID=254408 RepID=UPI0003728BC9|nr:glutathione S-transferase family protein [Solimonas variicoloris]